MESRPQAAASSPITIANTPNTAPATIAIVPLSRLEAFRPTSALASSISSRIRFETRSETSLTAVARLSGLPLLGGKALEDQGEQKTPAEGCPHCDLRALVGEERRALRHRGAAGGRRGLVGIAAVGHS